MWKSHHKYRNDFWYPNKNSFVKCRHIMKYEKIETTKVHKYIALETPFYLVKEWVSDNVNIVAAKSKAWYSITYNAGKIVGKY